MLKKIYLELVEIKKELQAIRKCLEPTKEYDYKRVDGKIMRRPR